MAQELDFLRQQLDDLQREVATLRQAPPPSRGKGWWAALAVALVVGLFAGRAPLPVSWAEQVPDRRDDKKETSKEPVKPKDDGPKVGPGDEIVCKAIKIVGADGLPRLQLGSNGNGGWIRVLGSDGNTRVNIEVDQEGGVLTVKAPTGSAEATLMIDTKGEQGLFAIRHKSGNFLATLGGNVDGGVMVINEKGGQRRAGIYCGAADAKGGLINLVGGNNKLLAVLGPSKEGFATLDLSNPEGKPAAMVSVDKEGGRFTVSNNEGKVRAVLWNTVGGKNGLLSLFEQGIVEPAVSVGADDFGGYIGLRNVEGKFTAAMYAGSKNVKAGLLNIRGPAGKNSIILDGGFDDRGSVTLLDERGTNLLFMGPSAKGHGSVAVRGSDGNLRVNIGVNDQGLGGIDAHDNTGALKGQFPK